MCLMSSISLHTRIDGRMEQVRIVPLVAAACSFTAALSRLNALSAGPERPELGALVVAERRPTWRKTAVRACVRARRAANIVAMLWSSFVIRIATGEVVMSDTKLPPCAKPASEIGGLEVT